MSRLQYIDKYVRENFHYLSEDNIREIVLFISNKCFCNNCECNNPRTLWSD